MKIIAERILIKKSRCSILFSREMIILFGFFVFFLLPTTSFADSQPLQSDLSVSAIVNDNSQSNVENNNSNIGSGGTHFFIPNLLTTNPNNFLNNSLVNPSLLSLPGSNNLLVPKTTKAPSVNSKLLEKSPLFDITTSPNNNKNSPILILILAAVILGVIIDIFFIKVRQYLYKLKIKHVEDFKN